ncbi:MAG: putative sulfate exporter family transporter [Negativicutes bacterium]|nr:putative sulfate exporter family transporter [Negativicutes bacterium]
MAGVPQSSLPAIKREDTWAIIIGMGLILVTTLAFFANSLGFFKMIAVGFSAWTDFGKAMGDVSAKMGGIVALYLFFVIVFGFAAKVMDVKVPQFIGGFTVIYVLSVIITLFGINNSWKNWMEGPLLALAVGIILGNLIKLPEWFRTALKTEFYVKTGIVLMGAILPFTIILSAGPLAILQASIVAITTFMVIFWSATRIFGLDPRFAACLGAGGSICGVSGAIAIGGACRAEKEHVSVAISLVVVYAVAMIFMLPIWAKALGLEPGPAGAWIGTSEFADAAGFAAAAAIGDERAIKTFTLMKVVGRDMFIGVWALMVAFLSVTVWEKKTADKAERVNISEIWNRFPKFVLGFFVASMFTTVVIALLSPKVGSEYSRDVLGVIKNLRGWAFTFTFLSIGFTTRFGELAKLGWKPLAAFTIGVLINVPLGYWLSNVLLGGYWMTIK